MNYLPGAGLIVFLVISGAPMHEFGCMRSAYFHMVGTGKRPGQCLGSASTLYGSGYGFGFLN
jgi:hypothetical protein